ncbi:MAG: DNA repair protein RadA [Spirochaetia bacterium]|nr:DNA repair protein RadA [Spirochaetia bacterium]
MKGKKVQYVCSKCGRIEPKWLGRCPDCGGWNTFQEEYIPEEEKIGKRVDLSAESEPMLLNEVKFANNYRFSTGLSELDRVMGGGMMEGSAVLVGGEPGIGKSTLMLQVAANCSTVRKTLYVSGEESPSQVKLRAQRLCLHENSIVFFNDTRLEMLVQIIEKVQPSLLIIDSLQTLSSVDIPSPAGSPNQMRGCAMALIGLTKKLGCSLFLIGHVTKDGTIAGPKIVEHLVDTVLYFEQSGSGVRMLRATKNRFGSVDEIGIFLMTEKGLEVVENPAGFFLNQRPEGTLPPGISFTAVVEGTRTFIVEIQALAIPAKNGYSRIYSDRIDSARVTRVAAVLERHAGIHLSDQDLYVNVGGGMKLNEVSIELPLALALWSSLSGKSLGGKSISFGEISLAGEVRPVGFADKRIKAAQEMAYKEVLLPFGSKVKSSDGLKICRNIRQAIEECELSF